MDHRVEEIVEAFLDDVAAHLDALGRVLADPAAVTAVDGLDAWIRLHDITGVAAALDLPEVVAIARRGEALLHLAVTSRTPPGEGEAAAVADLLPDLRAAVADDLGHPVPTTTSASSSPAPRGTALLRDLAGPLADAVESICARRGTAARLVLVGGATPVPEDAAPALRSALLHLVRNAAAHGIEPAGERVALGKPATGLIRLAARPADDGLLVLVSDDGAGIDVPAVRRAAGADTGAVVDDPVELVLRPGLSTAPGVTESSGRGAGLPAVTRSLETLGGTLELGWTPGEGTWARILLPARAAVAA